MHPSFGIEYQCPSFLWEDVMKGPSREAVLAHSFKVLHYRTLFGQPGSAASIEGARLVSDRTAPSSEHEAAPYATAA
jgi:hypothetical protein